MAGAPSDRNLISVFHSFILIYSELDRILSQLLNMVLTRHRQKLTVYNCDISKFEQTYRLDSIQFQEQFESGSLGDGFV